MARGLPRPVAALVMALLTGLSLVLATSGAAHAHRERPAQFPSGTGSVPTHRTGGPYLVVCASDTPKRIAALPKPLRKLNQRLFAECSRDGFHSIQAAVDAVSTRGTRILIQPGVYNERPSLVPLSPECAAIDESDVITYEQQMACPHVQNLITILGDGPDAGIACDDRLCDLQIEGTGAKPEDVIFDGRYKLNGIRADRSDGIYFRNFTAAAHQFNALYILETDGFVIDDVIGRLERRVRLPHLRRRPRPLQELRGLRQRRLRHLPGRGAQHQPPRYGARYAIEITDCYSHHNRPATRGTAGDSVWVHDNDFHHNSVGMSTDSLFPDHPGMPQDHSRISGNRIFSNNVDYEDNWRDGTCFRSGSRARLRHRSRLPSHRLRSAPAS